MYLTDFTYPLYYMPTPTSYYSLLLCVRTGGMQDYHYVWHGCMDITLELSCCKYPPAKELLHFWKQNQKVSDSMLGSLQVSSLCKGRSIREIIRSATAC